MEAMDIAAADIGMEPIRVVANVSLCKGRH